MIMLMVLFLVFVYMNVYLVCLVSRVVLCLFDREKMVMFL